MIRQFVLLAAAFALVSCAASAPAPVERRVASASPERVGGSLATPRQETAAAVPAAGRIVVASGATLYQISEQHRVSLRSLIDANALQPPFQLLAGQTLILPPPNTYTVRRGDTLNAIARRHRVQPRSLALLNELREPYRISTGDMLVLPGSARDWDAGAGETASAAASTATASSGRRRAEASGATPQFIWPAGGAVIDGFGPKGAGRRNDGVNIAARDGEPVRAAADGQVVYAGDELPGYGNLILIKHDGGWISAYAHNRALLVAEDQSVRQGQEIAEAGASGAVDAPQLHFELRRSGSPIDPLTALPPRSG